MLCALGACSLQPVLKCVMILTNPRKIIDTVSNNTYLYAKRTRDANNVKPI